MCRLNSELTWPISIRDSHRLNRVIKPGDSNPRSSGFRNRTASECGAVLWQARWDQFPAHMNTPSLGQLSPDKLSRALRESSNPELRARRWIAGLSLASEQSWAVSVCFSRDRAQYPGTQVERLRREEGQRVGRSLLDPSYTRCAARDGQLCGHGLPRWRKRSGPI